MCIRDSIGTTLEAEYARYDAVLFFESAADGGLEVIEGGNPVRTESVSEAATLDGRLRELWSKHPHFFVVPHNPSFFKKITFGLASLENIVAQMTHKH